jgi:glutamate N-acetyltransferase/amino-acid N-acetyltransferase
MTLVSAAAKLDPGDILPASTGVIGAQLKMDLWEKAAPIVAANLGTASIEDFAAAIMTTDAFPKYAGETLELGGGRVILAGVAKGAGMISPNMATMLSMVLCDAAVDPEGWRAMFGRAVELTFNRATVDGDTSTNDTLYGLANGASGVKVVGKDLEALEAVLIRVLADLAYRLVEDGEGATKVMHISVTGAASDKDAAVAARAVGHSPLVKTAMYGKDANWGRIICALGRSGVDFNPDDVDVALCNVDLFKSGQPTGLNFDALLKEPLEQRDLHIGISLGAGPGKYTLLASDLTPSYVSINANYRS